MYQTFLKSHIQEYVIVLSVELIQPSPLISPSQYSKDLNTVYFITYRKMLVCLVRYIYSATVDKSLYQFHPGHEKAHDHHIIQPIKCSEQNTLR